MFNNPVFVTANKIGLVIFWLACIFNLFQPFSGLMGDILTWGGLIILIAHVAEILIFMATLRNKSTNLLSDSFLILVFGVFHLKPLAARKVES